MGLHPLSDGPLPFGQLMDCGIVGYHEFACSRSTFEWLSTGAMRTIDEVPVRLQMVEECAGGHNLLVKAWPVYEQPIVDLERLTAVAA